ncbi:MAG: hypothetical protein Q9227_003083 [Pyrenula ochraceoflavens]
MGEFDYMRDVLGQLPFLKTYSHLLLIFPLDNDEASRANAIATLQSASLKLTEALPWLNGKVVNKGRGSGSSGTFEIEPCALFPRPFNILCVRDLSNICPPYYKLAKTLAPVAMLDGSVMGPHRAVFPESYQDSVVDPAWVMKVQASFIQGGLLVDMVAQHNILDLGGIEQCFNLLATAMRGEPFPVEAIAQANMDRRTVVDLLQQNESLKDHSNFYRPDLTALPPPPREPDSPFSWCYFRFSADKLAELKNLATQVKDSDPSIPPVSSNDVLTAFCWQRVTAIRLRRRGTGEAVARICRAVNARKSLGVPSGYMGNLITIAMSKLTFQELADAPLSTVAGLLRRDVTAVDTPEYLRSFFTFIANTADKARISYGGNYNPDTDMGTSSAAATRLLNVRFGPLGKPTLIRRPNFGPIKSELYVMPRTLEGDLDVLLCLNEHDMTGLLEDARWNEYAGYIG